MSFVESLSRRVRRGVDCGDLVPMSDDQIRRSAYFMLGAHSMIGQLLEEDFATEEIADDYASFIRNGLKNNTNGL